MVEHPISRWSDLFEQACRIIEQANSELTMIDSWTFGGGTALMLQIDHRESFDVDIFLDDPQLLPYLNPKTQGYALDINPDGYESDGSRTLKIVFENVGEIDFICAPSLTGNPTVRAEVRGRHVLLETPSEIIAKKVYYRGAAMQPRDMFDIACVMKTYGVEYLDEAFKAFQDKCEAALKVARQMNPQFAEIHHDETSVPRELLRYSARGSVNDGCTPGDHLHWRKDLGDATKPYGPERRS